MISEEKQTPKGTVLVMSLCDSSLEALAYQTRPTLDAACQERTIRWFRRRPDLYHTQSYFNILVYETVS